MARCKAVTRLERVAGLRFLEIVHVPGPGVMRIQVAMAKVEQSTLVLDAITSLHWGRVKGGAERAARRWRQATPAGCGSCFGQATRQKFAVMG